MPEEWRPIPSWPRYEVSAEGRVRNRETGYEIKPMPHRYGHLYFFPRRKHRCYIHRAVLEAFVGPCPEGQETRHLDGNPKHNTLTNLAWGTSQENTDDKRRHGTLPYGERSGTAKLTEEKVLEIRQRIGANTLRQLAAEYGVSHTAIRRAANGMKWAHLGRTS